MNRLRGNVAPSGAFEADVLAIIGGVDRNYRPSLWRSNVGVTGIGLAGVLAVIGAAVALKEEVRRYEAPSAAPSAVAAPFAEPKIRGAVDAVQALRLGLSGMGSPSASLGGETHRTAREASDARASASANLPASRDMQPGGDRASQMVSPRREPGGHSQTSASPRRSDRRHSKQTHRAKNHMLPKSDDMPFHEERVTDNLSAKKRSVIETRDALRDLRLK